MSRAKNVKREISPDGRIGEAFRRCQERNESALVVYLTGGYPSFETSLGYLLACASGGADVIEVGVPFSDPMADGPVIQRTSDEALRAGVTPMRVLELVAQFRRESDVPVVLMGYYNPIFRMGDDLFCRRAKEAGADGLIVADMPMEESLGLELACASHCLDLIQLVGPTTSADRMEHIASRSSGYLYLVSRLGTTGSRKDMDKGVPELVRRAKHAAGDLPVAIGFGISRKEHVREAADLDIDGVIVGSALLSRIIDGAKPHEIRDMVKELKSGTKRE